MVVHHGWQVDEAAGDNYNGGNDYSGGVEDNDTKDCSVTVTVDEENGELIVSLPDVHSQHNSVRRRDTHDRGDEPQLHEGHDQPVHGGAKAAHEGRKRSSLERGGE